MYQNLINLEEGVDKVSLVKRRHKALTKGAYRTFHQYLDKKANYRVQSDLYHNVIERLPEEEVDKADRVKAIKEYLSKPPNLAFPDFVCQTELGTIDEHLENLEKMKEIYQRTDQVLVKNEIDTRIAEIGRKLMTIKDQGYERLLPKVTKQMDPKLHNPNGGKAYEFGNLTYTKPANIRHVDIHDYKRYRYKILNSANIQLIHNKDKSGFTLETQKTDPNAKRDSKTLSTVTLDPKTKAATIEVPQKSSADKENAPRSRLKRVSLFEKENTDKKRNVSFQAQPEKKSGVTFPNRQLRHNVSFNLERDNIYQDTSHESLSILNNTIDQTLSLSPLPQQNDKSFQRPESAYFLPQADEKNGRSLTPIKQIQEGKRSGNHFRALSNTIAHDASDLTLKSAMSRTSRETIHSHHKQNLDVARARAAQLKPSLSLAKRKYSGKSDNVKEMQPTSESFLSLHETTGRTSKSQNNLSSDGLSERGKELRRKSDFLNRTFSSATEKMILPGFSGNLKKRFGIQHALDKLEGMKKLTPHRRRLREIVELGDELRKEVQVEETELNTQKLKVAFKHHFQGSTHEILQDLSFAEGRILETLYLYKKSSWIENLNDREKVVSEHVTRAGDKQSLVNRMMGKKLREEYRRLQLKNKLLKNEGVSISAIMSQSKNIHRAGL